ncbi:MAG: NAD(P)H-binding protein [Chloroflexi bacterium]|jgi:NADH dehydrogenase|nr:NAD(P)H-binding protein [Anaerolineaceae bacterium]NLI43863.1 NAD(P)H-binding protein [Chloroflexota bacterium]HOE35044.1 NAD(P)H-binding protein [Anaerolineaceae bacterium]
MILITGGIGFIGGELVRQLTAMGLPYRYLLQPGDRDYLLPRNTSFDIVVSALSDERGLKAALKDVDAIFHLSSVEQIAGHQDLQQVEVGNVETLAKTASTAGIKRFFYLSHLGADRASAFGLMKAKGIAEHAIQKSGVPYTIFRSSMVYGQGDVFSSYLLGLFKVFPFFVPIPGDGSVLLQPIWVGDLTACMAWSLSMPETTNTILEIGGPEHLSFREILTLISARIKSNKKFLELNPLRMNRLIQFIQSTRKGFPGSAFWLDYLAENRICALDSLPRVFGINPARFQQKIDYLTASQRKK